MIDHEMKNKVKKEYYRRVRKVLETKLKNQNVFKAINTWTISVVRYSAAFLRWSRFQLEEIDRRTKNCGEQDTVDITILRLRNYVRRSKERLLIAARTM